MKKMMFNDRFGLTQAVIEGRKTMTRRLVCKPNYDEVFDDSVTRFNKGWIDYIELIGNKRAHSYKAPCKVGEIVAIAQSYNDIFLAGYNLPNGLPSSAAENKMFVKAELMPHQIRITRVRAERLQDISDVDAANEGIRAIRSADDGCMAWGFADDKLHRHPFDTPREAYACLIDKISGKGTWERNPWVWVYEFELVK